MNDDRARHTRRSILKKLGLASTVVYAAPVLLQLSPARGSSASGSFSGGRPARRAAAPPPPPPPRPEIVVTAPLAADIDRIVAEGYTLLDRDRLALTDVELARFELPANVTADEARAQIQQLVPEALFDINHIYTPGELPCDDDGCVAFDLIGWQPQFGNCPAGTSVGIIDTSVNADHAALQGVALERVQVIGEGRDAASALHGTAVAILIAGRGDSRTPGLLEGVRLVAAEAFHKAGETDQSDSFDIARAVDRLVAEEVSVINMSFTGPANAVLEGVVTAARGRNVLLVAAAGNAGPQAEPLYPAAYEGVVAVTAVDADSTVYRRANTGAHVDFAAPGVNLWTAASVSGGRYRSGTSYAAPFVSAALAVARARAPDTPPDQLVAELAARAVDLGDPGRDVTYGWGLVQSDGACGAGAGSAVTLPQ